MLGGHERVFKRKGFLFDANLCIGCRACEMACRNENHTPANIHWRHVEKIDIGTYLSMSCNHCDSPECFRVCPKHAFTKRKDGIVEIRINSLKEYYNPLEYEIEKKFKIRQLRGI